jgi:hypothetical protein
LPDDLVGQQLSKSQDGDEGFVDTPLLFWSDVSDEITEPTSADGSHLFNEHPGGRPEPIDLRPERCGLGAQ